MNIIKILIYFCPYNNNSNNNNYNNNNINNNNNNNSQSHLSLSLTQTHSLCHVDILYQSSKQPTENDQFRYILKNIGTKLIFLKTIVLNWILTPNIKTN